MIVNLKNKFLFEMLRIRKVEEKIAEIYPEQNIRCPMHLSIGQESIPVILSHFLKKTDHIYSSHRSHAHYLAKGGNLKSFFAELYGKESGCCGGIGGSMHLIDKSVGFMASTPIVGGTVPLAVGDALSQKLKGSYNLIIVYFGDGCVEEGVVHEALNFSSLHNLPIIFVCENNNFSVYTKLSDRQPIANQRHLAAAHNIKYFTAESHDIKSLYTQFNRLTNYVKSKHKPAFFESTVYRWREHCGPFYDNELNYRSKYELEKQKSYCPIKNILNLFTQKNIDKLINKFDSVIDDEINQALDFAVSSQPMRHSKLRSLVYA